MVYKIIVLPRAQKEIENAIDYYALYCVNAPVNFIASLKKAYNSLEKTLFPELDTKILGLRRLNSFHTLCIS